MQHLSAAARGLWTPFCELLVSEEECCSADERKGGTGKHKVALIQDHKCVHMRASALVLTLSHAAVPAWATCDLYLCYIKRLLSVCSLFANNMGKLEFGPPFCGMLSGKMISCVGGRPHPAEWDGVRRRSRSGEADSGTIKGSHLSCCSNKIGGRHSGPGEKCVWAGYI